MSLEIIETGEVIEPMSKVEAERITARIADKLDGIADNLEQVMPMIGEALTRQAWKALGYASPTAYVSERFSSALQRLTPEVRRPIVGELSAAGMSTRAIAPIVGVSDRQVRYDAAQVGSRFPPASPASPTEPETVHGLPTTDRIVGMDGKTYQRPDPTPESAVIINLTTGEVTDPSGRQQAPKERRKPLPEQFFNASYDLCRKAERVLQLTEDDRFTQNREKLALKHRNELLQVISDLQDVITALGEPAE